MARSIARIFLALLVAAAGCAADPIPAPTSPTDPANPDAPEVPPSARLSITTPEGARPAETAASVPAPPAHHHHMNGPTEPMK